MVNLTIINHNGFTKVTKFQVLKKDKKRKFYEEKLSSLSLDSIFSLVSTTTKKNFFHLSHT